MTAQGVLLTLNGGNYHLRYPMRSVKKLKATCGVNLFALSEEAMADPDTMSAVLWAGLIHEHPDLSVDDVDGMYELNDLKYISDKIAEAMGGDADDSDPTETSSV